jgi:hypothetical protein
MDAITSRRRRSVIHAAQTAALTCTSIAVLLRSDLAAVIGLVALGMFTVAYFLVPYVEDPDPELSIAHADALRRLRDSGKEKYAVRDLRALHPNLGPAQASRIVRAL